MEHFDGILAADGIELPTDLLDRIDQIVAPGVTINIADNMWNFGTTALSAAHRRDEGRPRRGPAARSPPLRRGSVGGDRFGYPSGCVYTSASDECTCGCWACPERVDPDSCMAFNTRPAGARARAASTSSRTASLSTSVGSSTTTLLPASSISSVDAAGRGASGTS